MIRSSSLKLAALLAWLVLAGNAIASPSPRFIIWDDDGCDMTHYPYNRPDLLDQPASVHNFEQIFLEATEGTKVDVIGYSGTGFGFFTELRTGGYVNTNRFSNGDRPWRNAVKEFEALGIDSLDMATGFARRHGKEIFLSMRFNDIHDTDSTLEKPNCCFSPFKMQHPEWTVGRGQKVKCGGRWAADFAQPGVREFVRTCVRGFLENYDLDGIEFDFFRHPQLFRTVAMGGHATEEELAVMTELMRDFRRLAEEVGKKRGRPFTLCARVPDSREYCRAIGIDLDAWAAAKVIDFLIVGGYFQLKPWRQSADYVHSLGMKCYASIDESRIPRVKGAKVLPNRDDKTCWIARIAAAMASGMDGVNLFNLEYFRHDTQRWILNHDIRNLDGVNKTYFATYTDGGGYRAWNFLVGGRDFMKNPGVNPAEPIALKAGEVHRFDLVIGDDFAADSQRGLSPRVEAAVLVEATLEGAFRLAINGSDLGNGRTKKGITSYSVNPAILRKGGNAVAIGAISPVTLHDFRLTVNF